MVKFKVGSSALIVAETNLITQSKLHVHLTSDVVDASRRRYSHFPSWERMASIGLLKLTPCASLRLRGRLVDHCLNHVDAMFAVISCIIHRCQCRCILVSSQCFVLLNISVRKGCVVFSRQPRTWIQVKDLPLTDPLSNQTRSDFGSVACCFVVCPDQCPRIILQRNASHCPL